MNLIPALPREVVEIPNVSSLEHPHVGDNFFRSQEEATAWARERGLETPAASAAPPEDMVFHTPYYADGSQGSFMVTTTTRTFVHEPAPVPAAHRAPAQPVYAVRPCAGKDNGVFALRDVAPGETIMLEHPAVLQPRALRYPPGGMRKEELCKLTFSRLEEDVLQRLLQLKNCKDSCSLEEGIIRTNSVGVLLKHPNPEERLHCAVFLDVSRCNHSCGPNAEYAWDLASYSLRVFAARPIKAGEEITIRYINTYDTRADRQRFLRAMYAFDCGCAYCSLPDADAIARSDARRAFLQAWDPRALTVHREWFATPAMPAAAVLAPYLQADEYYEAEGLVGRDQHRAVVDAVVGVYGMVGDEASFRKWCAKAVELWAVVACQEEGRKKVKTYKKWLAEPSAFKAWNKRPQAAL